MYSLLNVKKGNGHCSGAVLLVRKTYLAFPAQLLKAHGIAPFKAVSFFVDDKGNLAFIPCPNGEVKVEAVAVACLPSGTRQCKNPNVVAALTPGIYHITGKDGDFFLTDIPVINR